MEGGLSSNAAADLEGTAAGRYHLTALTETGLFLKED